MFFFLIRKIQTLMCLMVNVASIQLTIGGSSVWLGSNAFISKRELHKGGIEILGNCPSWLVCCRYKGGLLFTFQYYAILSTGFLVFRGLLRSSQHPRRRIGISVKGRNMKVSFFLSQPIEWWTGRRARCLDPRTLWKFKPKWSQKGIAIPNGYLEFEDKILNESLWMSNVVISVMKNERWAERLEYVLLVWGIWKFKRESGSSRLMRKQD